MLTELSAKFGITLPASLVEELEAHSRKQKEQSFFLRLMNIDEIVEVADFVSEMEVYQDILPLWTDDHSNYIGLYVGGACKYRICYINHEETDVSPAFRSIASFIQRMELYPDLDWHELRKDYPSEAESGTAEMDEDLTCIAELELFLASNPSISDDVRCQSIFSIMALTPKSHLDSLLVYLEDEDMFVQERACEIFGFHCYMPAREQLIEVSNNGMHNGKLAAKNALAKIREKQAKDLNHGLFHHFAAVANTLNKRFNISPLLYGSLGLEALTKIPLYPEDIDLLIPLTFIRERWEELQSELEHQGYELIDRDEHEFSNGQHKIGFSHIEDLEEYAAIDSNDIEQRNYKGATFKLLNLEQYHRVYSRSLQDGYRIDTRGKKDAEKIKLIKGLLRAKKHT